MRRYITIKQLARAGACQGAIDRFREFFGSRVEVTVDKCQEYAHRFDFAWAMEYLLPPGKARRYGRQSYEALYAQLRVDIDGIRRRASRNSPIYFQALATVAADCRIAVARSFAKRYLAPTYDPTTPAYFKTMAKRLK